MAYKTATKGDLQAIAEKMLEQQLSGFRKEISELRFEVNRSRRETLELRQKLGETDERCRVLSVQLQTAVSRLTRAVNNV